jgi:acetyl-CoA C-acetyltransferase
VTNIDPRTPILVGAAQLNDRDHGSEPIDLMTRCSLGALAEAGIDTLAARIDAVRVVWGVWPYRDPGRLVADRIGASSARSSITTMGGNQVYDLVIDTALRIRNGGLDVAVLTGAETLRTRRSDRARGAHTEYLSERDGAAPDDVLGKDQPLNSDAEREIGIETVARFYAMAETALRHRLGEGVMEHRRRIARLWAGASEVAASNPDAWIQQAVSADEIAIESASNRPVASPYPKLMTSNLNVDQGGAVVMCSVEAAEAAGVPRDRWIFPWAGVGAADHWYPTNRWAFDESPAMRMSGERTLQLAGVGIDDCALLDLYSCFPVAVQVAQRELGVDPARPFTITGGLTFAAGPLNCYCLLPLTRAVALLREAHDDRALLTGNGGSFTKHSSLVLAGTPSADGFRTDDVQEAVDAQPVRPTPTGAVAEAMLETYTVTFDRDMQPERAIMACLDTGGRRHWAASEDSDTMAALLDDDCCEQPVRIDAGTASLV